MDYIPGLLPSVLTVKSEHAHKDKKQKNKNQQAALLFKELEIEAAPAVDDKLTLVDGELAIKERRCGEERRQNNIVRGRWLESREKQDRRTSLDIYVKI